MESSKKEDLYKASQESIKSVESFHKELGELAEEIKSDKNMGDDVREKKLSEIEKNKESLELSLEEFKLTFQLSDHFYAMVADKNKMKTQVKRLKGENDWLREELENTQQKLLTSELNYVELEEKSKSDIFQASLQKYDEDKSPEGDFSDKEDMDQKEDISKDTNQYKEIMKEIMKKYDCLNNIMEMKESEIIQSEEDKKEASLKHEMLVKDSLGQIVSNGINGVKGKDTSSRFRNLHNLVIQYSSIGFYEVSVPLCKQALEELIKYTGHYHLDVANMMNILCLIYRDQGKYLDACNILKGVLSIREVMSGTNNALYAANLNNLAYLHQKLGLYTDAATLCKRAIEIRKDLHGMDHPDYVKQLSNLSICEQLQMNESCE